MSGGDGKLSTQVERLRELIKNSHKLAPIAKLVDAYIESVDPGRVRIRYAVKPEFMHPGKAVQGGIVTVYADMAMAFAAQTLCGDGEFIATSQLAPSSPRPSAFRPPLATPAAPPPPRSRPAPPAACWRRRDADHRRSVATK